MSEKETHMSQIDTADEKLVGDLQREKVTCPICGQTVAVNSHPSPAWRSMLLHDVGGERCPGSRRGLVEARDFAR
jgi:hypothetical protein